MQGKLEHCVNITFCVVLAKSVSGTMQVLTEAYGGCNTVRGVSLRD